MPITTIHKVILGVAAVSTYVLLKRRKKFETKTIHFNGREVLVHVPSSYASTRILLYFHGNGAKLSDVSALIPIFDGAKRPPIVIAPQLSSGGDPGDLAADGAMSSLLQAVADSIPGTLNPTGTQIDIMSHSGGYRAAAAALQAHGGLPTSNVSSVGLLDSLYGNVDTFEKFAVSSPARHFVNIYGPSTTSQSIDLAKKLSEKSPDHAYFNDSGSPGDSGNGIAGDVVLVQALRYPIATVRTTAAHGLVPRQYIKALLSAFA